MGRYNSGLVGNWHELFEGIHLPLIVLVWVAIPLGVGALLGPMTQLVAVETWLIISESGGAVLTAISFWQSNCERLTEWFMRPVILSFRRWRPKLGCRWTELWPSYDRRF